MEEIWKDIKGYENLYQVSNLGRIKSLERYEQCGNFKRFRKGRILKQNKIYEYLQVCLSKDSKSKNVRINRIVALTFIPIPEELKDIPIEELEVDHIDGNPKNNKVKNLRWTTRKGNMLNPITRQRISDRRKGIIFSENHRKNMSEVRKGKYNTKKSKPVLQIDKDTNEVIAEFPSVSEVERQFGFYHSEISKCCNNIQGHKTYKGFKWKYKS